MHHGVNLYIKSKFSNKSGFLVVPFSGQGSKIMCNIEVGREY